MTQDRLEDITMKNAESIAELATIAKQTSKDTDKLLTHMDEMMPCREKVEAMDSRIEGKFKDYDKKFELLNLYMFLAKYPKVAVLTVLGTYALTIKEIRDVIMVAVGLGI